jgi:F-type H+-transporting ATPase subunit epsilon
MSDTAVRGKDLDEEKANAAKLAAEEALKNAKGEVDLALARSELTVLAAELSALRRFRGKK